MLRSIKESNGSVVIDGRYPPFVFAGWSGRVSVELIDRFFRWKVKHVQLLGEDEKFILIHDLTRLARPEPRARQAAVKWRAATREQTDKRILLFVAIVTNPVIRGALRALDWMGASETVVPVRSRADAIQLAAQHLVHHGFSVPHRLDAERYSIPSPATAERSAPFVL